MADLYKNKYRIPSARHPNWDYRWNAAYFITICTHNREHFFGKIKNGKMILSNVGVIADLLWHEIKNHTKNVELGEYIVMPNHIHGILILNNDDDNNDDDNNDDIEALRATPLRGRMGDISPKPNSISTIIRSYKSAVTKHCNRLNFNFKWQTRFHDHIIRNNKSFDNISNYIINNPQKWEDDNFFAQ